MGNVQVLNQGLSRQQVSYHLMGTADLYKVLEGECINTLRAIRSLQRERRFDSNARSLICQIMKDLEQKIHIFNEDMVTPASQSNKCQAESEEMQHLRTELNKQLKENERLRKAHKDIEALLSQTVNKTQRNVSRQAQQGREQEHSKQEKQHKKGTAGHTDQVIKELQLKVQNQEDEINNLTSLNESAQSYIGHLKFIEKELERDLKAVYDEKQVLVQRLSKIAGKRLVDDNPEITELSDPNRPQKLGVFYSELYDNEWTDAFDALTNSGYDNKEAIFTLRLTLINVLEFCNSKSSNLLKKTEEAVNFLFKEYKDFQEKKSQKHLTLKVSQSGQWLSDSSLDCGSDEYLDVQERWKPKKSYQEQAKEQQEPEVVKKSDVIVQKLKGFRKEVAESMVPIVQKAYISAGWKHEYILELKPFIKKCIFLGWMMVVQSPPMCLATCDEGGRFDKNTFKEFTKSGPTVDFVVLPALYLYENGPLIGKGVAEARK